ncbi:hypothetical protein MKX01_030636, partial [Papaver californicum]
AKGVEHVFEVLYGILHRQTVFQVMTPAYAADKKADTFELTNAFVKPNTWVTYFVDDLISE